MSQNASNFRFFNVFIIRQALLRPKVPKQADIFTSLQKSRAEIELRANLLALRCHKTVQDRELMFGNKVTGSKHNFTVFLKKRTICQL